MVPMLWTANVKLPYYGWFGETFSCEHEARAYVARMLWNARKPSHGSISRPSYRGRCYTIKPRLMRLDDIEA
jgi:hypothetical protein